MARKFTAVACTALGLLGVPATASAAEAPAPPESLRISAGPYAGFQPCSKVVPQFASDSSGATFAATPATAPQPAAVASLEAGRPGEEPFFRKSDTSAAGYAWSFGIPDGTFSPGTYQFRVRAENGGEVSAWSSWCSFKVTTGAPTSASAAYSPDNGGFCLDVNAGSSADGTKIQTWECNGTPAQQWEWRSGIMVNPQSGKCLDVAAAGTANGTAVQLHTCNGSSAQRWEQVGEFGMRNPASGRCLDIPAADFRNGNGVQIYDCNGTVAQRWQPVAS
ncbi:RICIN domain-containing protein [Actinocorallia populi]|uniref:RICIN domain-containing protein n=1 Tax=Actinocorallia populi TaxID=2079200 RepID=UPI000D092369|nr:RICIN domain-containing protein [Actinocorallia populi]